MSSEPNVNRRADVPTGSADTPGGTAPAMAPMRQLLLPFGPAAEPSFDSFVVGANAALLQHLRAAALPAAPGAPIYLWGPAGSGKTHLLRALAQEHQCRGGTVAWFDADTPLPWTLEGEVTLAVIDRCDALDAARQHAAFGLFVAATGMVGQLAAAGRMPPVDLALREDLRTRLGWGHVYALQPLAEADLRAALRQQADERGVHLGDEVIAYLLTHFERDMKHLTQLLERLDQFALVEQRANLTLPLLKRMLAQIAVA